MPTKLRSLKEQAILSCTKRLHQMNNFKNFANSSIAYCKYCNIFVQVIAEPLPNEINISGDAVAITCPSIPYHKESYNPRIKNPVIS